MFARIIAAESKRRYRVMQIELDEVLPMIVEMLIGAEEISQKEGK